MILEDLYYGRLHPNELIKSNDPKFQRIDQEVNDSMNILRENLSEDDFEQIEKLFDLLSESNSLHSAAAFIHGFRTGASMMIEIFSDEKSGIMK
ncbi:hypothetical protein K3T49_18910 [Paenibacillus sonchi]|nr:DUF6809 family protein [Paenibacillus riograndensis]MCE3201686.1 hypothetical protein [Paenibacillus sonchi]